MPKKLLDALKYLFFLGIGVFLVWWSLHNIPDEKWNDFKKSLTTANYWLMLPVFLILTASHVLRSLRWQLLIRSVAKQPSFPNTFFAVMIGYLANLAVPRLGEVLKCTILAKYEQVPADKLVGTIVAERAVDVICLMIVFVLAFVLQYDVIGVEIKSMLHVLMLKTAGNKLLLAEVMIGLIVALMLIRFLLNRVAHIKLIATIINLVKGIWEGFLSVRKIEKHSLFFLHTLLIWVLYIGGTWIGLYATAGTAHLSIQHAISGLAFASIGMIITPGGIGAYAYFLAKVLEKNNVPFEIGFANGTLQWFAQFLIVMLVGFICLLVMPVYNKNKV